MATIGLIRHGVTDWNQEKRAQGQRDVPLNEAGVWQAERLGMRLAGEGWDLVYSSDLSRAGRTAEIIAAAMGRSVDGYDPRLREKTYGRLDGTTVDERVALWGESWRELEHGEESDADVLRRSMEFLKEVTERHSDKKVLVVTHGALIRVLMEEVLEEKEFSFLNNTSVNVLEQRQAGWHCVLFNCTKHLETV